MFRSYELYDLSHTIAADYLHQYQYPWEALEELKSFIVSAGEHLPASEYTKISDNIWIHNTARVAQTAHIEAPCIIGANTEVRHCAFIRGAALIGESCVIGNSTELKNVILFDGVQVPHFNYVGDSILGYKAHLGAGVIVSNLKSDKSLVVIHDGNQHIHTGMKKLGAIIGDFAEVGCNTVLNPGTVIGRHSSIYPTSCVRGVVPAKSIHKTNGIVVKKDYSKLSNEM